MSKVKKALAEDAPFLAAAAEQPGRPDPRLYWFSDYLTPRHQALIAPLTTLLLLDGIVDAQDVTTFDEASTYMPRALLNASLTQLRLLGWVQTDGVAIKILWRPTWRPAEDE